MKDTRLQIQDYIIEKISSADLHTLKVKQITSDLHISRSTFYLYYDSVFAVLQEIEDEFFDGFQPIASAFWNYPLSCNYLTSPHPVMVNCFRYLRERQKVPAVLWGPYGDMRFQYKCKKMIEEVFFPPEIARAFFPVNTKYHTHYAVGGHLELINYWIQYACSIPEEELATMAYRMMFGNVLHTLYPDMRHIPMG